MRLVRATLAGALAVVMAVGWSASPSYAATITVTLTPVETNVFVDDDSSSDTSFSLATPTGGTYDVTWWVEDDLGVDQSPAGTLQDVVFVADTAKSFDIDLTGLTEGSWFLRANLTNASDSGTSEKATGTFMVLQVSPHFVVTKASGTFYPVKDGYLDTVSVSFNQGSFTTGVLHVINAADEVVASPAGQVSFVWHGQNLSGQLVPEGVYTFELIVTYGAGIVSHYDAGSVTLSHKRMVNKTFKKTVTPAASLQDSHVGRCSALKRPAERGWKGSFGYYTGAKCKGTYESTLLWTEHAIRVPRAIGYKRLTIFTYGGAAKSQPGSYLFFDQLKTTHKWGTRDQRLGYNLGSHRAATKDASQYVFSDRFVAWGAYTYLGAKYDVKSFTVVLTYQVLQ